MRYYNTRVLPFCIIVTHTLHTNNNGLRLRSSLKSTWLLPLRHSVLQAHSHSPHNLYSNTTIIVNHRLCNILLGIRLVLPSTNLTYIYTLCNSLQSLVCQPLHYIIGQTIFLHTITIIVVSDTTYYLSPLYYLAPRHYPTIWHHDTTILSSTMPLAPQNLQHHDTAILSNTMPLAPWHLQLHETIVLSITMKPMYCGFLVWWGSFTIHFSSLYFIIATISHLMK